MNSFFVETYIFWAIISAICGGLYAFTHKMIVERNYDINLSNIYVFIVSTFFAFFYCLYAWGFRVTQEVLLFTTFYTIINVVFYYISLVTCIKSLENIDSVVFFPLYKTFWPILVTCISILYFWELLSGTDILWIAIGITIPLLLISRNENRIQKNLFLGIVFVVITSCVTAISSSAIKMMDSAQWNQDLFLFLWSFWGILMSLCFYIFHSKKSQHKKYKKEGIIPFSLFAGVLNFLTFYAFIQAVSWNFAIAFTINSFSILIPVILSIIFYNEHFNVKKGVVIVLSIISILFFI